MKKTQISFPSDSLSLTKKLVESALMVAMATVLSLLKLAELPNGGSVTAVSSLPILLIAYRFGTKWGLGCGFTFAVIQQMLGLKNLTYVSGWYSVLAVILLDYLLAFTVLGLAGMFRGKTGSQSKDLLLGTVFSCFLRYLCSLISGAVVWNEFCRLAIPSAAVWIYSIVYNASYMIPETVATALAAVYLGNLLDFRMREPMRIVRSDEPRQAKTGIAGVLRSVFPLPAIGALIYDVIAFFATVPIGENNRFVFSSLTFSAILPMLLVSAACASLSVVFYLLSRSAAERK